MLSVSDQKTKSTVLLMLSWCQTRRQCYLCCHGVRPEDSVTYAVTVSDQTTVLCYLCCHGARPDDSVVILMVSDRKTCYLCCYGVRPEDSATYGVRLEDSAAYAVTMSDQTTVLCYLCCHGVRPEDSAAYAVTVSDQKTVQRMLSQCQTSGEECSALSWEEPTTCC